MYKTGVINFQGNRGGGINRKKLTVKGETTLDLTKLDALAGTLNEHSDCVLASVSLTETQVSSASVPSGTDANVDKVAVCVFQDTATGAIHRWELPSPLDADIESTPAGDRLKNAIGIILATAFSTALDIVLKFVQGWIETRK